MSSTSQSYPSPVDSGFRPPKGHHWAHLPMACSLCPSLGVPVVTPERWLHHSRQKFLDRLLEAVHNVDLVHAHLGIVLVHQIVTTSSHHHHGILHASKASQIANHRLTIFLHGLMTRFPNSAIYPNFDCSTETIANSTAIHALNFGMIAIPPKRLTNSQQHSPASSRSSKGHWSAMDRPLGSHFHFLRELSHDALLPHVLHVHHVEPAAWDCQAPVPNSTKPEPH